MGDHMTGFIIIVISGALLGMALQLYRDRRLIDFLKSRTENSGQHLSVVWDQNDVEEIELMRKRVELSMLQNQINPHFLYNTLDSIRSKALIENQTEIADMTEALARFFRYCIGNHEKLVKVREELKHIEDYFHIQEYRFEDRFRMEIYVEEDDKDYYLPKMTLQPLVENALLHGLEAVNRRGMLNIRVTRLKDELLISVSDNGIGMDQTALQNLNSRLSERYFIKNNSKNNGIAGYNVNSRIKLIFGEEYGITYQSEWGKGTDALIRLPLVDDFSRGRFEEQDVIRDGRAAVQPMRAWKLREDVAMASRKASFLYSDDAKAVEHIHVIGIYDAKRNYEECFEDYLRKEKLQSLIGRNSDGIEELPPLTQCVKAGIAVVESGLDENLFKDLSIERQLTLMLPQKKYPGILMPVNSRFQHRLMRKLQLQAGINAHCRYIDELENHEKKILQIAMWAVTGPKVMLVDRPFRSLTENGCRIISDYLHLLGEEGIRIYCFENQRDLQERYCDMILDL